MVGTLAAALPFFWPLDEENLHGLPLVERPDCLHLLSRAAPQILDLAIPLVRVHGAGDGCTAVDIGTPEPDVDAIAVTARGPFQVAVRKRIDPLGEARVCGTCWAVNDVIGAGAQAVDLNPEVR